MMEREREGEGYSKQPSTKAVQRGGSGSAKPTPVGTGVGILALFYFAATQATWLKGGQLERESLQDSTSKTSEFKLWASRCHPLTPEQDPDGDLSLELERVRKQYKSLYNMVQRNGVATPDQVKQNGRLLEQRDNILLEAVKNATRPSQVETHDARKETDREIDCLEEGFKEGIRRLRAKTGSERAAADKVTEETIAIVASSLSSGSTLPAVVRDFVD